MGEEVKQQEQPKAEEKVEEKKEEKEEAAADKQQPPSPFVLLFVDLHCMGCANKIERSILKIRGVEGVVIDMAQNHVTVKGVVEPEAVCTTIEKKTRRRAKVLSPLPAAAEGEPIPQLVASQVTRLSTVELNVNMHCEACAHQLKRKILKMRGVQTAETELNSGKVTVTGSMDANRLVEYVYRRTKKQAKVVPQPPEPEKAKELEAKPQEAKVEEKPNGGEEPPKPPQESKEEATAEKKEVGTTPSDESEKKEGGDGDGASSTGDGNTQEAVKQDEMMMMRMISSDNEEQIMQKMMHYYQPLYLIERIPPPQLFSDENPNACCIT